MRRLLRALVLAFPAPFRERFGDELLEQALADVRRGRARGLLRGMAALVATGTDLLAAGLAERVRPTWRADARHGTRTGDAAMITSEWIRELRVSARSLRRSPGFLVTTVATLALALGVNAGMYAVVDAVLLRPLPYEDPGRLVHIAASAPGSDLPDEFGVSSEFYLHYRAEARSLEDLATYDSFTSSLRVGDRVERIRMSTPSHSLFSTLGASPILGRIPSPDEESTAIISHRLWQTWFGGDPDVIGRAYPMMGASRAIVGVMGPDFAFPNEDVLLWMPLRWSPENVVPGRFGIPLVGRMAPGADRASVAAELRALARGLPEAYGGSAAYRDVIERHVPVVRPLREALLGDARPALWTLMGAVAVVLLIACANVANLFTVRAAGRGRELAVRRAVGAGRANLVRTQLSEAVVVAALAGALGLLTARLTLPLLLAAAPQTLPRAGAVGVSWGTLAFTGAACGLAALACGLLPALRASVPDFARLRDGAPGFTSRRVRARDLLVVGQTALALVLLVGSGLLLRSFVAMNRVDPGYDTEGILTFQFAPEEAHLTDGLSWAEFHLDFMARLRALPGVESVGIVENVPLDEGVWPMRFRAEEAASPGDAVLGAVTFAGGDYFETMGIEVLWGRGFTDEDALIPGRAVISETAARLLWPGEDPIGRRIRGSIAAGTAPAAAEDEEEHTVVGVVEDVLQYAMTDTPEALVYYPMIGPTPRSWVLPTPGYVVRAERAEELVPVIRELIREVSPTAPMYRTYTMESLVARSMTQLSVTVTALGTLAAMALLLSAIGLYGVLSYVVSRRTQEIGLRMALGARAGAVRRMVVLQGIRVVLVGVALGIGAALGVTRVLERFLFGVGALDLVTFGGVAVAMVLVGVLASYLPARRASRVEPLRAMRGV